jgi:signal transduction histidine kinase
MENGLRGYLLLGENSFVKSYDLSNNENDSILKELALLITDSSQNLLLKKIEELNDKWTGEYLNPLMQAGLMSGMHANSAGKNNKTYTKGLTNKNEKRTQAELQSMFRELTAYEYKIRDERKLNLSASVRYTRKISLFLTVVSIIGGLVIIIFLVRKISRRIREMTSMADNIAAGNYNISLKEGKKDELSSLVHSLNYMANELSKNISLLVHKNEELDQFAHIVSHDLKGPLRGIGNVISWIEEDHSEELTARVTEYLTLINGRILKAENLISGLLSYASVDKGDFKREY